MSPTSPPTSPKPGIPKSLLARARNNDPNAVEVMFRQFLMPGETLFFAEFLGTEGIWGIGTHSFAALTDRRLATMRVGAFGEVIYQDGLLEFINSTVVHQPSKLGLYLLWFLAWGAALFITLSVTSVGGLFVILGLVLGLLVGFMLMVAATRLFYRFAKCGAVWWIREGVAVYAFCNRKRLVRVNALTRQVVQLRDALIQHTNLKSGT